MRWEYLERFLFGGIVTVITGLIAQEFGVVVVGLFLAFPGIFPASATLVERHERKKKREQGLRGDREPWPHRLRGDRLAPVSVRNVIE